MKLLSTLILFLATQVAPEKAANIRQYLHREHNFLDQLVTVCGVIDDVKAGDTDFVLFARYGFEGLIVDMKVSSWREGDLTCVRGVMTRADGLSRAEVFARKSFPMMYDSPNPAYIIRNE